jgi:hypothetical protein
VLLLLNLTGVAIGLPVDLDGDNCADVQPLPLFGLRLSNDPVGCTNSAAEPIYGDLQGRANKCTHGSVDTLDAGTYRLIIRDQSRTSGFRIVGPGSRSKRENASPAGVSGPGTSARKRRTVPRSSTARRRTLCRWRGSGGASQALRDGIRSPDRQAAAQAAIRYVQLVYGSQLQRPDDEKPADELLGCTNSVFTPRFRIRGADRRGGRAV